MTASSGPGLSLMQEGISYLAGAELPCVIVDVMRGGPGLGNIAPEQSDDFAMVKGGGHGNYHNIVLEPASVQEWRNDHAGLRPGRQISHSGHRPSDGFVGRMMEKLELQYREFTLPEKSWAVKGTPETRKNLVSSIFLEPVSEAHQRDGSEVQACTSAGPRHEEYRAEDADVLLVGFGTVSRVLRSVVEQTRRNGLKVGYFGPSRCGHSRHES